MGSQGGYFLAKSSGSLTAAEIITALDGSYFLEKEEARDDGKGEAGIHVVQAALIDPINEWIDQFLNTLTLKDLVECSEKYRDVLQDMYYI